MCIEGMTTSEMSSPKRCCLPVECEVEEWKMYFIIEGGKKKTTRRKSTKNAQCSSLITMNTAHVCVVEKFFR